MRKFRLQHHTAEEGARSGATNRLTSYDWTSKIICVDKNKAPGEYSTGGFYQSQLFASYGLVTGAAVATAATAASIFAWLSFVNLQCPSSQILAIELLDGSGTFFLG